MQELKKMIKTKQDIKTYILNKSKKLDDLLMTEEEKKNDFVNIMHI